MQCLQPIVRNVQILQLGTLSEAFECDHEVVGDVEVAEVGKSLFVEHVFEVAQVAR